MSQKKSYKKAPQGKMDVEDEQLLLTLASKYKHDWKKSLEKNLQTSSKKVGSKPPQNTVQRACTRSYSEKSEVYPRRRPQNYQALLDVWI